MLQAFRFRHGFRLLRARGLATTAETAADVKGLRDDVASAARILNIIELTPIQKAVIPKILEGNDVIIASQTGTGKTLSFVLPLFHRLKEEEDAAKAEGKEKSSPGKPNRPRAVIVVPSLELACQVASVVASVAKHVPLRICGVYGGVQHTSKALDLGPDIVIGTPTRLLAARDRKSLFFTNVGYLVLDEADTMFDDSFADTTMQLLRLCKSEFRTAPAGQENQVFANSNNNDLPSDGADADSSDAATEAPTAPPASAPKHARPSHSAQLIVAGAAINDNIMSTLTGPLPGMQLVATKTLHRPPETATHRFIDAKDVQEKLDQLIPLLKPSRKRIIVFCNNADMCHEVAGRIRRERTRSCVTLHSNHAVPERLLAIKQFRSGLADVLVCTDVASRGIDIPEVDLVVNFDFPYSSADYLHRAGRTARAGLPGAVASLTTTKDTGRADSIKDALRSGRTLRGLYDRKKRDEDQPNKKRAPLGFRTALDVLDAPGGDDDGDSNVTAVSATAAESTEPAGENGETASHSDDEETVERLSPELDEGPDPARHQGTDSTMTTETARNGRPSRRDSADDIGDHGPGHDHQPSPSEGRGPRDAGRYNGPGAREAPFERRPQSVDRGSWRERGDVSSRREEGSEFGQRRSFSADRFSSDRPPRRDAGPGWNAGRDRPPRRDAGPGWNADRDRPPRRESWSSDRGAGAAGRRGDDGVNGRKPSGGGRRDDGFPSGPRERQPNRFGGAREGRDSGPYRGQSPRGAGSDGRRGGHPDAERN